jgi:hypothetical protein
MAERRRELARVSADRCCGAPRAPRVPARLSLRRPQPLARRNLTAGPCC